MKTCTKCKEPYSATTEYFYYAKCNNSGLSSWCKKCANKDHRRYSQTEKGKQSNHRSYKKYHSTIKGYLRKMFSNVKQRCNNTKHKMYYRYGGRGIELRFTSNEFVDYVNELGVDPRGLQIDRINNDGHYERGNIQFVTHKENRNNRGK